MNEFAWNEVTNLLAEKVLMIYLKWVNELVNCAHDVLKLPNGKETD